MPERLEKSVEIGTLCAFYGSLLTERQQEALRLYYQEDLSLAEIAEQTEGTRQNVHELITRSAEKLRRYEQVLGMAARAREEAKALRRADGLLAGNPGGAEIAAARDIIARLIREQEGEEKDNGI